MLKLLETVPLLISETNDAVFETERLPAAGAVVPRPREECWTVLPVPTLMLVAIKAVVDCERNVSDAAEADNSVTAPAPDVLLPRIEYGVEIDCILP